MLQQLTCTNHHHRTSWFRTLLCLFLATVSVQPHSVSASSAGAAASALKALDYRYFVAGGTCAAISHGITTPIDVVKTRIQANPKKYGGQGLAGATISIVKEEGPGSLLTGLGPTVVGYGIEGAMKFGVYELCKPLFADLLAKQSAASSSEPVAVAYLLASITAGAVAALLLCPMESLRIRQVTDPAYANDSLVTGLPKLIREAGMISLFGGVWAMLAKQVPYTFGKQVSFDVVARMLYSIWNNQVPAAWRNALENPKVLVSVVAAFLASIVACLFSQPGDMILTETYKTSDGSGKSTQSFGLVLSEIYRRGGVGEFFRGTKARIVHVGMIITSQLVIYDIVKQLLGLPATGSH